MRCPFCGSTETQVKDSRITEDGNSIRRRRQCLSCSGRFTTFEHVQVNELVVQKKDGKKRPFNRDKLTYSINIATRKRTINERQIEEIVSNIVDSLESRGDTIIKSSEIGKLVLTHLKDLDLVAYTRYASVYSRFENTEDFIDFISNITQKSKVS